LKLVAPPLDGVSTYQWVLAKIFAGRAPLHEAANIRRRGESRLISQRDTRSPKGRTTSEIMRLLQLPG